ncbi:unnamed protein product [Brachionus calyciflorus]|uniref:Uncharacterized protein n=1 Tax=Brachionus calyciflorus TaxID=104777 RepID=A0A814DZS8_9BILA|nr:unnamed protein product [Brachionus calyciflorus]
MDHSQVMIRMNCGDSLVKLCLSLIVNMVKNEKLQIDQISKLPKNLVSSLLNTFSKRGLLTDDNIQFFLNENTRELELSECDKLSDKALEKISLCKYLRKIDLNSHSIQRTLITGQGISNLVKNCKFLTSILLRRCSLIDDECIDIIAKSCPKLKNLNIANCSLITDQSFVSLGKYCNNLESINFSGTKVTDNGVFYMFSKENVAKSIQEIHIAHCDLITDESIECILINCRRVKYLLFHECPKVTVASRIALEDYLNSSDQKVKHLTWTIY